MSVVDYYERFRPIPIEEERAFYAEHMAKGDREKALEVVYGNWALIWTYATRWASRAQVEPEDLFCEMLNACVESIHCWERKPNAFMVYHIWSRSKAVVDRLINKRRTAKRKGETIQMGDGFQSIENVAQYDDQDKHETLGIERHIRKYLSPINADLFIEAMLSPMPQTNKALGKKYGITAERVRQLLDESCRRIPRTLFG